MTIYPWLRQAFLFLSRLNGVSINSLISILKISMLKNLYKYWWFKSTHEMQVSTPEASRFDEDLLYLLQHESHYHKASRRRTWTKDNLFRGNLQKEGLIFQEEAWAFRCANIILTDRERSWQTTGPVAAILELQESRFGCLHICVNEPHFLCLYSGFHQPPKPGGYMPTIHATSGFGVCLMMRRYWSCPSDAFQDACSSSEIPTYHIS